MYMGNSESISMNKTNFDPYTGTEYQHDFYHYGFKKGIIGHEKSVDYQKYVDDNHLYVKSKSYGGEWVKDDDQLYEFITGINKSTQQAVKNDAEFVTKNAKTTYKYKVKIQPIGSIRGVEGAKSLGIRNNSIIIVDTDNGVIKKRFKLNSNTKEEFNLYYFMHPIVSCDSAGKTNYSTDKIIFTNGIPGAVNCYALMCRQEVVLKCNNTQIAMDYNVRIKPSGATEVLQEWIPRNKKNKKFTKTRFLNANKDNNRGSCGAIAETLTINNKNLLNEKSYRNAKYTYDDAILALMRKRTGDLFQGFLTKHFKTIVGNTKARQYSRIYDKKRPNRPNEDPNNGKTVTVADMIRKGGDILTVSGDYPYLSWCLENGVNVLFRAPKTQNVIHFIRDIREN